MTIRNRTLCQNEGQKEHRVFQNNHQRATSDEELMPEEREKMEVEPIQFSAHETEEWQEGDSTTQIERNRGSDDERVETIRTTAGSKAGREREHWKDIHRQLAVELVRGDAHEVEVRLHDLGLLHKQGADKKKTPEGTRFLSGTVESVSVGE